MLTIGVGELLLLLTCLLVGVGVVLGIVLLVKHLTANQQGPRA